LCQPITSLMHRLALSWSITVILISEASVLPLLLVRIHSEATLAISRFLSTSMGCLQTEGMAI
ncbi:hypothetical protein MAX15_22880, partial [Escherichia coli]